jgi:hypothetical protein
MNVLEVRPVARRWRRPRRPGLFRSVGAGGGEGPQRLQLVGLHRRRHDPNFEKETGIKVRYDNFDNNEIVHAKLVAGKTGYDIVVPSSNWAKLQIDGGLLRKLDKASCPT